MSSAEQNKKQHTRTLPIYNIFRKYLILLININIHKILHFEKANQKNRYSFSSNVKRNEDGLGNK